MLDVEVVVVVVVEEMTLACSTQLAPTMSNLSIEPAWDGVVRLSGGGVHSSGDMTEEPSYKSFDCFWSELYRESAVICLRVHEDRTRPLYSRRQSTA